MKVENVDDVKIHKFIECAIPIKSCNLRCPYCYVTQNKWWSAESPDFSSCKTKIKDAFSIQRLGGTCMINMCATGETLIHPDVVEILKGMLECGHYVMLVTNGTLTKRFETVSNFSDELRSRLFFKVSFHYLELKKRGLIDTFFNNITLIHNAGISFTVELTPDDCYIPYIDEIKTICEEKLGALCHVTVPRDETKPGFPLMTSLSRDEFRQVWSSFDSELFRFKESIFEVKRREFCYAGQWSFVVDIITGEYFQCYGGKRLGNVYDLSRPIKELAIGRRCPEGHCFNGHAFLGFGLIPIMNTPTFCSMRNRKPKNGGEWLKEPMKSAMEQKLVNDNEELSNSEKRICNLKSINPKAGARKVIKHLKK